MLSRDKNTYRVQASILYCYHILAPTIETGSGMNAGEQRKCALTRGFCFSHAFLISPLAKDDRITRAPTQQSGLVRCGGSKVPSRPLECRGYFLMHQERTFQLSLLLQPHDFFFM